LSQEKVLKTLESLGFAHADAQIYVLLGRKGPQKARGIANFLKMPKQTLYSAIKNLQAKGIVTATLDHPAKFSAVPFERVLDVFVKAKLDEAQRMEQDKKNILIDWHSITLDEATEHSAKFTVLKGKNYIYPKLKQMVKEAKEQLSIIFPVPDLLQAERFGLLDDAFSHASKTKVKVRFLTEMSAENLKVIRHLIERKINAKSSFEARAPELGLKMSLRMLIKDGSEASFFINQETDQSNLDADELCLWTNSKTIANSFQTVFEDLWQNSTDIKRKIVEIETGKPTPKSLIIRDHQEVKRKYTELISQAEKEITIMTSSKGLDEVLGNTAQLKEKAQKGIFIKIMMPITKDNLKSALQLSEFCKVRHISTSHLNTTVIDRMHIFQFKNPSSNQKIPVESSLENTFYTNEAEYLEMTNSMLDSLWENSYAPSAITLEEITKPIIPLIAPVPDDEYSISKKDSPHQKNVIKVDEEPSILTENDILNRIINAKRKTAKNPLKCINVLYGSTASAVFHPPSSFNLPDMIIIAIHSNKKSTFGGGDSLQIHSWLETPKGHAYVPVAFVVDNPKSRDWAKAFFAGTPAGNNCQLIRKDELEIQVQGSTLFAGWTVPIRLFPTKYTLAPACLLFEGYGKLKTSAIKMEMPSGATLIMEGNGFDAFATFFHPASKYAGPGTDATIGRDIIITAHPAQSNKMSQTTT